MAKNANGGEISKRQQLPPQIKKISAKDRSTGKSVVRYQVTADGGHDPVSGKRRQVGRRFTTETSARAELAAMQAGVAAGTSIHASKLTVDQVCEAWLASKHSLKDSTLPTTQCGGGGDGRRVRQPKRVRPPRPHSSSITSTQPAANNEAQWPAVWGMRTTCSCRRVCAPRHRSRWR